ncbi:hypothetical protein TWF225_010665 [Orbilia oligospora]|nr:hypothetical protein TWF751_004522 [Orbilia oligospora]KAF3171197.1 hypothetical protein TWF225_010665 [Orbilia oligospora]KAF3248374.1 hypothetical protein TWF128_008366 [Orbilia oligospora]KAF3256920.1 hypothetical protein TWF217_006233 [Orbilia oligospora]KAF3294033.1 hypothetical protein TWF132_003908 [Orbilia oligospora]
MASRDLSPLTSNYWRRFWRSQHTNPPPFPKDISLTGKVAIVTGSNTGLGFESSRQFLSLGLSRLIMGVRSIERGEEAAARLRTSFPKAIIEVWVVDMASYDSIQKFVHKVEKELDTLDIAVLNAGINRHAFGLNKTTRHEETLQINYLSTFLLAILLLPSLKSKSPLGSPGRLTVISSALANIAVLPEHKSTAILTALDDPKNFGNPTYGSSKLLGHYFLWKLMDLEYVKAEDVVINLIEPGFLKGTEFNRDVKGGLAIGLKLFQALVARTVTDAGTTVVDAIVVKGKEAHGCYMADWEVRPFPPSLYTQDGRDTMDKLWGETMAEFGFANARGILEGMK